LWLIVSNLMSSVAWAGVDGQQISFDASGIELQRVIVSGDNQNDRPATWDSSWGGLICAPNDRCHGAFTTGWWFKGKVAIDYMIKGDRTLYSCIAYVNETQVSDWVRLGAPANPERGITTPRCRTDNIERISLDIDSTNLLSRADLSKDTFTGHWSVEQNQVVVAPDNWARLCLPWQPTSAEYDVTMEFTRHQGKEGFGLLLTSGGADPKQFLFQLSAVGNQWVSINSVRGEPSNVQKPLPLGENGERHILRVQMRRTGVEAYLDGSSIFLYGTDYSEIQSRDWGFGKCSLGLISWYNVITFHKVEVKQVSRIGRD
jgi:hypothetical protein